MQFLIADTFTDALARLPAQEQKAVKVSVLDLQLNPAAPGLQMHRIDRSKDANFWSARVGRDVRLILHKTSDSILVAYVGHHDAAYAWAERRRIETHPRTGAVQIVEVRERVEEADPGAKTRWAAPDATNPLRAQPLFGRLSSEDLLAIGVPQDWVFPVQSASEAGFFDLAEHLPAEAAEALLEFATAGRLHAPTSNAPLEIPPFLRRIDGGGDAFLSSPDTPVQGRAGPERPDPFLHPDAQRRFRRIETSEELQAALDAPWDRWAVFLHPSQRAVVDRSFSGPARVAGSAGTGKTVVALHRTVKAAASDPAAKVLLTTFSAPLANSLRAKVAILAGPAQSFAPSIVVSAFEEAATDLFQLAFGRKPRIADEAQVERWLEDASREQGLKGFSQRFLAGEWRSVVDAWRIHDPEAYAEVPRLGRKNRLGARQRAALWPVFEAVRDKVKAAGQVTWAGVFHTLADRYASQERKPFTHVVVDEAQDLGVAELRFMCAIVPQSGSDRLFFAGDLGQRIFQQPFSWKALGADVRGRSYTLKVNYRTSQQIRETADRLLPPMVRDVDGREEERAGAISVFEGPNPQLSLHPDQPTEQRAVAKFLSDAVQDGLAPSELAIFVRSRHELPRARAAVMEAGMEPLELSDREVDIGDRVSIGTMHLAKGLEFKAVAVMACDDEVLPSAERIDAVVEESDLDDVYETERHLLYVACTRARDRLQVSGVSPGSEFLADLRQVRRH